MRNSDIHSIYKFNKAFFNLFMHEYVTPEISSKSNKVKAYDNNLYERIPVYETAIDAYSNFYLQQFYVFQTVTC